MTRVHSKTVSMRQTHRKLRASATEDEGLCYTICETESRAIGTCLLEVGIERRDENVESCGWKNNPAADCCPDESKGVIVNLLLDIITS